jgi:hypothetical protein
VLAVVSTTVVVASLCWARPAAAQARPAPVASAGALDLGHPEAAPEASSLEDYRSPVVAGRLSTWFTLGPLLGGLTLVMASANSSRTGTPYAAILGGASIAFGLTLGPSVGYAYSGEHLRGWGAGVLRLVGLTVGTVALVSAWVEDIICKEDCSHKDTSGPVFLGLMLVTASVISAIYDVAKAPDAARRSNARNGLSDLNLVPVVAASGPAALRGLALAGRF